MTNVVLFDLGNTLAYYFERREFPEILKQAIIEVRNYLFQKGLLDISLKEMWRRVKEEDYEASDYRVRPLEERLLRIFQLNDLVQSSDVVVAMYRFFMKPIFARSYLYEDTLPALEELKSKDYKMAVVSNTTWGSPAFLWREEIERLGLSKYLEATVFCRDVGWRKPAKQIFRYALKKLQVFPQNCVFVGDDPRWDFIGPRNVGIEPIIIDRKGAIQHLKAKVETIRNLNELLDKLKHI